MTLIRRKRGSAGHAIVELSLMMPWIVFLFVGALDFGFYSYALIATQNAARVAALYTAQCAGTVTDQTGACQRVQQELGWMPNASSFGSGCGSEPLVVTTEAFTDAEGQAASRVRVSYQTVQLIPIPGLVPGRMTIARTAQLRVFGD